MAILAACGPKTNQSGDSVVVGIHGSRMTERMADGKRWHGVCGKCGGEFALVMLYACVVTVHILRGKVLNIDLVKHKPNCTGCGRTYTVTGPAHALYDHDRGRPQTLISRQAYYGYNGTPSEIKSMSSTIGKWKTRE